MRFGRLAVPVINDNPDYKLSLAKVLFSVREKTLPLLQTDFA